MIKYKTYMVEEYLKKNKISKAQFCQNCGISAETLRRFLKGHPGINLVTSTSICSSMGVALPDFIEQKRRHPRKLRRGIIKKTSII